MTEENVETQTQKEGQPTQKANEGIEKSEEPKVNKQVGTKKKDEPKVDLEKFNNQLTERETKIKDLEGENLKLKEQLIEKELSGRGLISEPPEKDTRTDQQFAKDFLDGKIPNPLGV